MKFTDNVKENQHNAIEVSKHQEKELTLLGNERRIAGLNIWEYEKETGICRLAEYVKNDTYVIGMESSEDVFVRSGCIYVQATRKEVAIKKAKKRLAGFVVKRPIIRSLTADIY